MPMESPVGGAQRALTVRVFCANLVHMLTMSAFGVARCGIKFMTNVCVHC